MRRLHHDCRRFHHLSWLTVVAGVTVVSMISGCDAKPTRLERDILRVVDHYGGLKGVGDSPNEALRNEVERIRQEGGMPRQLDEAGVPDEENLATGLVDLVKKRRIQSVLEYSEELLPGDWLHFEAPQLEEVRAFLVSHHDALGQIDAALTRPRCDFHVQHAAGYFADTRPVEYAVIAGRLKTLEAAVRLHDEGPAAALGPLRAIFRLAECLSQEKQVTCRLHAARLRHDALLVMAAIVADERAGQRNVGEVYELLRQQLDGWAPESDVWIGDRALGMHVYEVVRDGRLAHLLTDAEHDALVQEAEEGQFLAAAEANVDGDELFYLETMRKLIDACDRPSYDRGEVFTEIDEQLGRAEAIGEYPLVAGRMLLTNVRRAQETMAADRAMCEVWALALASALDVKPPSYSVNPFTGEAYRTDVDDGIVYVYPGMNSAAGGTAPEQPITIRQFRQ
ncbi:MAG: hypothetical protein KDA63_07000 [Planctomycetales bacterium]|nr:hypothetical protein [Planctomycetales bacterium]